MRIASNQYSVKSMLKILYIITPVAIDDDWSGTRHRISTVLSHDWKHTTTREFPCFTARNTQFISPRVSPTGRLHDCRAVLNATGPGGALSSVSRALGFPHICVNEHGSHCNINSLSQVFLEAFRRFSTRISSIQQHLLCKKLHLKIYHIIHQGLRSYVSSFPCHSTRRSVLLGQHL